jgi:hypothetical protein
MRRLLLAVAALLITAAVAPPLATAQAPTEDSVVAEGGFVGVVTFEINVRSGPSGEQPTGVVNLHFGGGLGSTYSTNVTCLAVSGNTAVIGFAGTLFFFGEISPVAGLIRVVDGGGSGSGQDTLEGPLAQNEGPPANPAPNCSAFPGGGFVYSDFPAGDIVVTDAPATPTSKDQCKNGGWRNYGIFKNQGDCVSFVPTKGKNPPANTSG